MYVSYEYYVANFNGTMPCESFVVAEAKAESILRYLTFHNGDIFGVEDIAVKNAVCAAADIIYQATCQGSSGGAGSGSVKSVVNDGYSVSLAVEKTDGETAELFLQRKVRDAVAIYLMPTGWLSRLWGGVKWMD